MPIAAVTQAGITRPSAIYPSGSAQRPAQARASIGAGAHAVIVDFSPRAFSTPSPYDQSNGQITHLGARPELLADLDATRKSIDASRAAEQKAKEDEKANKTVKPFTLKDFLQKLAEKYDVLAAQRQERRNPGSLTAEQRALLRDERLGPLWRKRFSLRG